MCEKTFFARILAAWNKILICSKIDCLQWRLKLDKERDWGIFSFKRFKAAFPGMRLKFLYIPLPSITVKLKTSPYKL